MEPEVSSVPQLFKECAQALEQASQYLLLVRSGKLQKEEIERLTAIKERIRGFKRGAIQMKDERSANALFHMQCALNAVIATLRVWVFVKARDNHEAWNAMIDAEEYINVAERAFDKGLSLDWLKTRLEDIARVVFPSFGWFSSWGAIIRGGTCTVCRESFGSCEHAEGKIYWGKLCVRVHPEILDLDHSAMVEDPKDRRCIITEITTDDGQVKDVFSLRTKKRIEVTPGSPKHAGIVLFSNRLIEVD